MKKSASFGAVGQDAPTTSNEWNIRSHASIYLSSIELKHWFYFGAVCVTKSAILQHNL